METALHLPLITLTTDFGVSDHYVGAMKGVIHSRWPGACIVDICHEVPPFSVWSGAYTLAQSYPYFPPGTVHVVVVDPGVGTARKPILVQASGQQFIAPDNGVLSFVLNRDPDAQTREITNRELFPPAVSATFHGRDVFAPVGAALASNRVRPEEVGPVVEQVIMLDGLEPELMGERHWRGRVLSVDHFGNVITNFRAESFLPACVQIGDREISSTRTTFGDAAAGELFLYAGSSGCVEIAINRASAARLLKAAAGDSITLTN